MNVLQPGMLWLLAAMAIPVLIHLYNRKRAVKRRFPAIEFLLASNQRLARRLKVRQLLLLALRVLLFGLLPFAIARPYILSESGTTADERLPAAIVLVVDDSASMRQAGDGARTAWDTAKSLARERIDDLRDIDKAALVFTSSPESPAVADLTDRRAQLVDALSDHDVTWGAGSPARALEIARDIAAESELPARRIVLITDLAKGGWPDPIGGDLIHGIAEVELVDVGQSGAATNIALTGADFDRDASGAAGSWEIAATVEAWGLDAPREVTVHLEAGGKIVASATTEVPISGNGEVSFIHRIDDGGETALSVRLDPADGGVIDADDVRHLVISGVRQIRVLMVNGDPRTQPLFDEVFFLAKALKPGAESRSLVVPRITTAKGLSVTDLEEADVVVLSNVATLAPGQVTSLTEFVKGGGGLFITLGDQIDPIVANRTFEDLFPKPLRSVKKVADRDDPDAAIKVTHFDRLDYNHTVMRSFGLPGGETMQKVQVFEYMLLEPDARGQSSIIASYTDGGPALVERAVGAGRVIMLTTSIDRDWTDLALRKPFVPLMQRLAGYLARRGGRAEGSLAIVGKPYVLPLEGYQPERVAVVDSAGDEVAVLGELELLGARIPPVTVSDPGSYGVKVTEQGVEFADPSLAFVAVSDPHESDVTRLESGDVAALWTPAEGSADDGDWAGADERRVELAPILLLTVLILLYLETLVGFRRSFLRRLTRRKQEA